MEAARAWRLARWSIGLATAWSLAVVLGFIAWGGSLEGLGAIHPRVMWAAAALFAANIALRFWRWHAMLAAEGHHPPLARSFAIFMAGLALLPTPAKAGVAVRAVLLLPLGVPAHVSLAAYFAERLLDFVGLVMMAALVFTAVDSQLRIVLAAGIGVAATAMVFAAPAILAYLRAHRHTPERFARAIDWLARFLDDARTMIAGWRFPAFVAAGAAANVTTALLLWLALRDLGSPVESLQAAGMIGISHLSGSISLLPGGLGGFELAMLAQLESSGVPAAQAVVALALVRLTSFWAGVIAGIPLLWLELRRARPSGT